MATDPRKPLDCDCGTDANSALPIPSVEDANGNKPIRVLLIDDDNDDHLLTREILSDIARGRFSLDWVSTYEAGLSAICDGTHHVYLLDYRLGARTGIELLREAQGKGCSGPVILLTGQGKGHTDLDALAAGADDYLEKAGLTSAVLERSIRYALAQHSAEAELERKVQERTDELAKVNKSLRDADRRKDEFLSTLGHELRNPLAPMLNALEIMRLAGERPDVIARQRDRLERQTSQLVRLVDDLLDVSRVVTGKLRLNPEPVTLQEVIEAALDLSRPHVERAKLELTTEVPTEPITVTVDRVRIAQILSNLLNNAAKYTEAGGRVSVIAEAAPASVRIRIKDTGVGIPADVLPHIFDLFTQVDRHLNRSQGGLGVGLALVRKLAEMHGGTVRAHSAGPGTGAEFTIELPLVPPAG